MSNPFVPLQGVLDLLVAESKVLPAFGRALVELALPDLAEEYDREIHPENRVQGIWETDQSELYHSVTPLHRREGHILSLFARGSTRLFFLATLMESSTPVQLAQIGVAVLERDREGVMRIPPDGAINQAGLMLDVKRLSDHLRGAIEAAMPSSYQLWNTGHDNSPEDRRLRGARVANQVMRQLGGQMAQNLPREADTWLVLGQSLGNEFAGWHGPPLIGVTPDFRQDLSFAVKTHIRSLYEVLAGLRAETRTAVFPREWQGHRGEIVSWYVRIRDSRGLDFPLAGVVRVEMPNPGGQKVDTALIDRLSKHLIAERTVAPHGTGPRWHSNLYPLHLVEKVVRGRFHSEEVVKAGLRWRLPQRPRRQGTP